MKYFLLVALLMLSSVAGAAQLNIVGGLTDAQEAELILQAANLAAANEATPEVVVPKVDEVREWAELINVIGDGMVSIAAKTGMAVNDFSDSKVGMFTMFIIGWNYLGHDFLGFIFGSVWLLVMLPGWLYCYRRLIMIDKITYFDKDAPGGKRKEVVYGNGDKATDTTVAMYWIALALISLVGLVAAG